MGAAELTLDLFGPGIDGLRGPRARRPGRPALRVVRGDAAPDEADRVAAAVAPGGGPTLDDLVVGVWEGLTAKRAVACPMCGAAMRPRFGAGAVPVGGWCDGCRTTIS
jgi:hypothetical protein